LAHEMFLAEDFYGKATNIYASTMIIASRSRQIAEQQRKEMDAYLTSLEMTEKYEEGEEGLIEDTPVFHEPMLQFEKPTILALREMMSDKLVLVNEMEEEKKEELPSSSPSAYPSKLSLTEDDSSAEHEE